MGTNEIMLTAFVRSLFDFIGAGNGDRTRDPRLGKPMLYQLSYARTLVTQSVVLKIHPQYKKLLRIGQGAK